MFQEKITLDEAYKKAVLHVKENTIGVLSEKMLHSTLKYYFCDNEHCHEVKYKGFVADVIIENTDFCEIFEIQTRQTYRLCKKLKAFCNDARVNVVIPMFKEKIIEWYDANSGELKSIRKSSRPKNIYHCLAELYDLREFLLNENVYFILVLLNGREIRYYDAERSDGKKRTAKKINVIPEEIVEMKILTKRDDFFDMIPMGLNEKFTVSDFSKAVNIDQERARRCMLVMNKISLIENIGKNGRKKLCKILC